MVIAVIGITYDLQVNDNLGSSAYASSHSMYLGDSISLITLSIQNLANEKYNEGYLAGYQASNSHHDEFQQESELLDTDTGINNNYYPNYNNPYFNDFYYNDIVSNPVVTSVPDPVDYSKLCIDEYGDFKEPTINLSVSPTWNKSTIGSPISGNVSNVNEFDSVIVTVWNSVNVGKTYYVDLKSDGSFWIFMDKTSLFDSHAYGEYRVTVQYEDQCGFKNNILYTR